MLCAVPMLRRDGTRHDLRWRPIRRSFVIRLRWLPIAHRRGMGIRGAGGNEDERVHRRHSEALPRLRMLRRACSQRNCVVLRQCRSTDTPRGAEEAERSVRLRQGMVTALYRLWLQRRRRRTSRSLGAAGATSERRMEPLAILPPCGARFDVPGRGAGPGLGLRLVRPVETKATTNRTNNSTWAEHSLPMNSRGNLER